MQNLAGKTALVTCASRGIGRASAIALAKAGAQILVHYSNGEKEAAEVVAEIRNSGGRAEKIAVDLRSPAGPHALAQRVRNIIGCRLDVLVANAGISMTATIEETTVEDFDNLFAVNVRASYFLIQQLMPIMCKGSSIVLLSTCAARTTGGKLSAHAATRGAIEALVKHLAVVLGERGTRVNAIALGGIETELSSSTRTAADGEFALTMPVLMSIAKPDDIGEVVVFLASNGARWITGETLHVDGGSKY
jgi:NAD(P)-dependent dehydrogenase (short-subunit alcohol dehydrogenase family)